MPCIKLQKFNNSKPDLSTGQKFTGVYCGVQFSLDKQWYRGKVINQPDWQTYNVRFVDFGNGELKKSDELRHLDEDMLQHPAQVGLHTGKYVQCLGQGLNAVFPVCLEPVTL